MKNLLGLLCVTMSMVAWNAQASQANFSIEDCDRSDFQTVLNASAIDALPKEARAYWLTKNLIRWPEKKFTPNQTQSHMRIYHSLNAQLRVRVGDKVTGADGQIELDDWVGALPIATQVKFKFVAAGATLKVRETSVTKLRELHKTQMVLVHEDKAGKVIQATRLQTPGAIDELYVSAAAVSDLGVTLTNHETRMKLWAPTAQRVALCSYETGVSKATAVSTMMLDVNSGVWQLRTKQAGVSNTINKQGNYYTYLVDVFVPGVGVVRNRVTDPYSISLTVDSKRSYIGDLNSSALKPTYWNKTGTVPLKSQTDMVIYELHVRDFSINDNTVDEKLRGKYGAFTQVNSNGMKHLKALSEAGITDIHLLPIFDIATVPEQDCVSPPIATNLAADSEEQQAGVTSSKEKDCFNWGYDPYHYTAPEGSYASDAVDGAARVIEARKMIKALHDLNLRVGMDVVYNHTSASGQQEKSVLDRIVPGYYHRLNADGAVEMSTCCDNTATEHMMMAKLMIDSTVTWAKHYMIDSFRFDLMAHQPRDVMERLKAQLKKETRRDIQLIGEGWNFGEVENGKRFVQASQRSLNGSNIGTFSDRARDAVRGGGPMDGGVDLIKRQGYTNGLFYDRNELAPKDVTVRDIAMAADMVRVGLAGTIKGYSMPTYLGRVPGPVALEDIDYNGQPAGYAKEPSEVVNYVENHDNQTLFDINVYKLPITTTQEDRARAQILALAINAFSQGIAYFHAGGEILRSKSLDRNSYDSGDWFNRIDWSLQDNYFATGLPLKQDNGDNYALMKPLLTNAMIKPRPQDIRWTRDTFLDLLRIRASSTLFRLRTAKDIQERLVFHNTGPQQIPTVLVGELEARSTDRLANKLTSDGASKLNGKNYDGAQFKSVMYFVNVDKQAHDIKIDGAGKQYELHPVHVAPGAADMRVKNEARFDRARNVFSIPARSAVVFVVR